ncbi:hypothetical protein RJ641_009535 [Dillenia turbinata]|uniref:Uncharacterized protein n=1 Tax=Dillenia turbinata TaxID=194707 RepID=A0AAN8V276_9MAGN
MLRNPKVLKSTVPFYYPPKPFPPQIQTVPASSSPQSIKLQTLFSRPELAICCQTLFFGSLVLNPFQLPNAQAEENPTNDSESVQQEDTKDESVAQEEIVQQQKEKDGSRAFIDISICGEPIGHTVIGLNGETRFSNLVTGRAGISY